MARNEATECGVCSIEFDEGARCPRILDCFHYLCSHCLHQLIKNDQKKCPFCRREFQAGSAADISVNHGVLDLMKYIAEMDIDPSKKELEERAEDDMGVVYDFKEKSAVISNQFLVECQTLQERTESMMREIREVRSTLHEENSKIDAQLLHKINEIVSGKTRKIQELNQIDQRLQTNLSELKRKHTDLQNIQEKFDTSYSMKEVAATVVRAEEANADIGRWIQTVQENFNKDENTLQESKKELQSGKDKVDLILEILSYREDDKTTATFPKLTSFALFRNLSGQMTVEALTKMEKPVRTLMDQGKVFAVVEQEERKKYAKLSFSQGKLHLHHFMSSYFPSQYQCLEYNELLNAEQTTSPRLAFLDLCVYPITNLGRVYIRLRPDINKSKQFSLLCTGEKGPCYLYTKISDAWLKGNKFESLRGGDTQSVVTKLNLPLMKKLSDKVNDRSPLVNTSPTSQSDSTLSEASLNLDDQGLPWLEGTVEGVMASGCNSGLSSQFIIRTRSNPGFRCPFALGVVEKGLNIIKTALDSHTSSNPVYIKDCGIVLSVSKEEA